MRNPAVLVTMALANGIAAAQSFNIDINFASGTGSGAPSSTFGGAANQPGTWNSVGSLGQSAALVGLNGAATGVTVRIDGAAVVHATDDASATGDYAKLVEDGYKLADDDAEFQIGFWGLTPGVYAIFTYADDPADGAAHSLVVHGWGELAVGGTHALNQFSVPATHAVHLVSVEDTMGYSVRTSSFSGGRGVLAGIQVVRVAGRLYVNENAAVGGDGRTWATATRDLVQALEIAGNESAGIPEIWVAQGTYVPGDSVFADFDMPDGVALYGGFAGTETSVVQRNIAAHPTVLSGEIGGAEPSDNCERIVRASLCGPGTVIDGFTITAAQSTEGLNGAMFITDSQMSVRNCRFVDNAGWQGAAIAVDASNPRIESCIFLNNEAAFGAGVFVGSNSNATIVRCDFQQNHASGHGGAIAQDGGAEINIANCRFLNNDAEFGGGALSIFEGDAILTNCIFVANSADNGPGGALEFDEYATGYVFQCAATLNHSNTAGGGLASGNGTSVYVRNSVLFGNTDLDGSTSTEVAQLFRHDGGSITASSSDIQGWSGSIPGAACFNASPLFVDVNGADNIAGTLDDDLRLAAASPCIDRGSNDLIPWDEVDLDHDAIVVERISLDLAGNPRRADDPNTADGGVGSAPIVDVGAYEFGSDCVLSGDSDSDGDVDLQDLATLLSHFGSGGASAADGDTDADGDVDLQDLASLLSDFGTACS